MDEDKCDEFYTFLRLIGVASDYKMDIKFPPYVHSRDDKAQMNAYRKSASEFIVEYCFRHRGEMSLIDCIEDFCSKAYDNLQAARDDEERMLFQAAVDTANDYYDVLYGALEQ